MTTKEQWLVKGEKIIDIATVRTLKVSLIAGRVDILGHDEPGARIEVHSIRGKALKISVDGDALEIDHPQLNWDNFIEVFKTFRGTANADISVMVPRDVALKFGVISAKALISGLATDAKLSTLTGDIVIDNVSGDLELNAINGEMLVRDHHGGITSKTVSGDVTASGEISKFRSDGISGNIFLDIAGFPSEIKVNTISGDITTRLAWAVPTRYRINTVSGKLQLDHSEITGIHGSYSGEYGEADKRRLDFTASTVSGNIAVLHAMAEMVTPDSE